MLGANTTNSNLYVWASPDEFTPRSPGAGLEIVLPKNLKLLGLSKHGAKKMKHGNNPLEFIWRVPKIGLPLNRPLNLDVPYYDILYTSSIFGYSSIHGTPPSIACFSDQASTTGPRFLPIQAVAQVGLRGAPRQLRRWAESTLILEPSSMPWKCPIYIHLLNMYDIYRLTMIYHGLPWFSMIDVLNYWKQWFFIAIFCCAPSHGMFAGAHNLSQVIEAGCPMLPERCRIGSMEHGRWKPEPSAGSRNLIYLMNYLYIMDWVLGYIYMFHGIWWIHLWRIMNIN